MVTNTYPSRELNARVREKVEGLGYREVHTLFGNNNMNDLPDQKPLEQYYISEVQFYKRG